MCPQQSTWRSAPADRPTGRGHRQSGKPAPALGVHAQRHGIVTAQHLQQRLHAQDAQLGQGCDCAPGNIRRPLLITTTDERKSRHLEDQADERAVQRLHRGIIQALGSVWDPTARPENRAQYHPARRTLRCRPAQPQELAPESPARGRGQEVAQRAVGARASLHRASSIARPAPAPAGKGRPSSCRARPTVRTQSE